MYGIFTYIWVIFRANVGKYSIHGASGRSYHDLILTQQEYYKVMRFQDVKGPKGPKGPW
jgi:hypothetical protein